MNNDNLRSVHGTLKEAGYTPPEYDQFAKDMEDDNNLQGVWNTLKKEGYTPPEYKQFKKDMGFGEQPQQQQNNQATQQPIQQSVAVQPIQANNEPQQPQPDYEQASVLSEEDLTHAANKIDGKPDPEAWRNEDIVIDVDKNGQDVTMKRGDMHDKLYKVFSDAMANAQPGGRSAYAQAFDAADQIAGVGLGTSTKMGLVNRVNMEYAKKQAQQTVANIISKLPERTADPMGELQRAYYDKDIQNQLYNVANTMGNNYDEVVNKLVKPQLIEAMKVKYGGTDNDWQGVRGLFSNWEHVNDRWEREHINSLLGDYFLDDIKKALDAGNAAKERVEANALNKLQGMNEQERATSDIGILVNAIKGGNQAADPDAILQRLLNTIGESATTAILQNPQTFEDVWKRAAAKRMDINDYIAKYVAPELQSALTSRFEQEAVKRALPKDTFDYIMKGITEDNVAAMIANKFFRTEGQNRIASMADMMTEEGKNPNVTPGLLAEGARLASGMAADFWLWGGWGKIGNKVAQKMLSRRLTNLTIEKGLSEAAAREVMAWEAKHSLKGRALQQVMQHIPQSVVMGTGASTTSGVVRGIKDNESAGDILTNAFREIPGHVLTFGAFGGMSALTNSVTANWKGWKKLLGKLMGYEGSALTLYGTGEMSKALNGQEAFERIPKGLLKAQIDQLAMHFASNPGKSIKGLLSAMRHPVSWIKTSDASREKTVLTDKDVSYLTDSEDGKRLMDALANIKPKTSTEAVKDNTALGSYGTEETAASLSEWLNNKDIPQDTKQRVGSLLGFIVPRTLETGSDITVTDDGTIMLKTRDQDGNCVREIPFESQADATQWQSDNQKRFELNDMSELWNGTTKERRMAAVVKMMDETGLQKPADIKAIFEGKADEAQTQALYNALKDVAVRVDEPNAPRFYEQGRQLTVDERHDASLKEQRAFRLIEQQGADFATDVLAGRDNPDVSLPQLEEKYGPVKTKMAVIYYNNYANTKGMMDEIVQQVDNTVERANDSVRQNSHPSGQIIEVDYFGNRYYLTGGDLSIAPDGTVQGGRGNAFVLRDATTGDVKIAGVEGLKVLNVYNAEDLMRNNEQTLRSQVEQKEMDTVNYAPGTPEDAANGDIYIGADGQRYMAVKNGDTGEWMKVAIDEEGKPAGNPQPFDINEYRAAKSSEIDAAEHPDDIIPDVEVPVNEEKETIPLEGSGLDYTQLVADGTNTVTELTLDDGNKVWLKYGDPTNELGAVSVWYVDDADGQLKEGRIKSSVIAEVGEPMSPEELMKASAPQSPVVEKPVAEEEQPAEIASAPAIPTDEKGQPIWEDAKPEDTLSVFVEKYGEEKANDMFARLADTSKKAYQKLEEKGAPDTTDANELMAYEDALTEAKRKADYWQSLVKPAEEKPVVEKPAAGQPVNEVTANQQVSVTKPAGIRNQSAKDSKPVAPKKVAKPKTPALTAEEKVAVATVKNNIGKTFEFNGADGSRTEITIEKQGNDGRVTVMQQLYDTQGQPVGEAKRVIYNTRDVGNGIVKGQIKPVLDTEGKLREAFKGKVAMQNIIDVLSDEERQKMLQTYQSGDKVAFDTLLHDFRDAHHEDLILRSRDKRNEKIDQILNSTASREDKLRQLRQLYDGDIVEGTLSNEALHPSSLEEWVSELNSRVPKKGEGPLAYFSYDKDGTKVVGMQDETGYGTKSAGDTKGFAPWLAPKGKGISLQKYAELLHEQLPEGLKEQYSEQDVRNAVLDVFGGAERPSDIPTMIIRRGIIQAEEAMRRMEEQWIEGGPSFQKKPKEFAARLKSAVDMVNTEPTEAQKAKGNYRKGHVSFGGYDYTIENPAGSVRRGTDANGKQWEQKMNNTYGYILGKYGKDGDHLDMFINDAADLDNWDGTVYVVDQVNKDGSFDEHKVMYGFDSLDNARKAYLSNYEEGWQGLGNITGVPKATFDKWLDSSKRKMIPFAEHSLSKKGRSDIQGLEDYSEDEIKKYVREYVQEQIANSGADAEIIDMKIIGSRVNGDADKDSDLDVLVEYKGKEREDGMFDMLNNADEPLVINGIKVDINPITRGKSGSIDEFMKRNADYQKEQKPEPVKLGSEEDKMLRDTLQEELTKSNVPVVTDKEQAQKVLDEYNDRVKLMGSTTRNRQNDIGSAFDGKKLTNEQRTVVDVFSGKTERAALSVKDKNNKNRNILFRQGNENKAGVKHSIFRHYSTDANGYTADEVLMIPDVISNGERKQDAGNRVSYKYEKDGVVYTVTTEVKGKDEVFTNFYTNRKPSVAEQGTSNTENRHVQPQQPVSGAKVQQNTETSKDSEQKVKFSKVENKNTLDELNNGPTVQRYRAMQLIDGKLYPPMSAKVNGEMREPTEIGVWEQSEKRPDLIDKNGKFKLNKGQKGQSDVSAAYNPYFHTSTSGLNDQFTTAYKRPELVVVEVEIPESELTSGYKAEGAKDAVGDTNWHSGPVNNNLPEDRKRTVTLSRYAKVNRIVPDSEVADMIAKQLEGTNAEVPYNVVTPQLRKELEQRGVKISSTPSGTVTEDINGNPINKGPRYQKVDKPVFYSNAMKAVDGIKQEKATAEQWLAMIQKNGGLKVGEDKWLGLSDWLNEHKGEKLTKQDVQDFIRQNQIQIEETHYQNSNLNDSPKLKALNEEFEKYRTEAIKQMRSISKKIDVFGDDMFEKYGSGWANKLEGDDLVRDNVLSELLEKYKNPTDAAFREMVEQYGDDFEMAFEVFNDELRPVTDYYDEPNEVARHFLGMEELINSTRLGYTTDGLENKREIALTVPTIEPYNEDDSIHFGDAGGGRAVAWVRFGDTTDKDGKLVLVIDEIQSKRHQEGRKKGYKNLKDKDFDTLYDEYKAVSKKYNDKIIELSKISDNKGTDSKEYKQAKKELEEIKEKHSAANKEYKQALKQRNLVPDAPFDKNWHELAMKRMLRYAAENGYDKIAWTTGEQQAERYDIGKVIDRITINAPDENGKRKVSLQPKEDSNGHVNMMYLSVDKDGIVYSNSNPDWIERHISEVVGKELADKIMSAQEFTTLEGDALRIGAEGMMGFYDEILPRFMDKYGKKWGVKVSEVELPEIGDQTYRLSADGKMKKGTTMWSIDVTPEMKESVLEGQPMFFKTKDGQAYGFTMDGKIYVDPEIATSETPIHEYTHLWADMKRKTSPDEWNDIKKVLLGDELIKPIIDKVRDEYPELIGNEDSFAEEVLTQYSGKRGSERLRQIAAEIAQEEGGGVFGKAKAVAAVNRLRQILNEFWSGVAKMMGWKYTSAADIADKALHDLLSGVNPNEEIAKSKKRAMPRADQLKQRQLDIILKENPADDVNMPGHTWIRSIDDVKTFAEAVAEDGYAETEGVAPDFTAKMVKDALNHGIVTVYSSKPIEDGIFVTPSKMEAQNYAGDGKIYSKQVPLTDVAWIDPAQGQYAKVSPDYQKAKNVELPRAKNVDLPKKEIEELYTEGLTANDSINMQDRVHNMSPKELVEQYKRLNDSMLDKDGLNIDEQEQKFRNEYFSKHGLEGFGKASADFTKKMADKYTYNKMALRWEILDRIKDLGLEAYVDKDLENMVDPKDLEGMKTAEFVRMAIDNHPKFQLVGKKGAEKADKEEGTTVRQDNLKAQIDGIYNHKTVSMSDAKDLYHNLAGEVEARNATARMNMSDTERRNRPAGFTEDVARDKQVVITPDERRERLMNDVDEATAFVTGRSVEDVRNERLQREKENAVRNDERPANPMEENFVKFQKVRKPTPHEMRDTLEKQADARRTDVAVRKAAEAGIKAPSEQEYMRQADNEYFRLEKEWHEKYDGTEYPPPPPDRWMMQADAQRRYREARNKYEQDIEQYKPVKDEQLSREDVIAEREAQSKTPGQKLANRLQAIMASEQDPETAADSVHQAVIDRRKTISEMSSSDAIYINEIGNKIKQVAKELSEDGNKISANDIQDAIPYIIEAPMRRNDIARNINQELQAKDSPVYITGDDLKFAGKEIDAMRNEAKQLLEVNKAMEEEGRTQMTVEEQELNGRVRSLADDVAQMLNARYDRGNNPVTADDVIASLDQFVREIVPEVLKVDEDTKELIPIISGIKDWYNIAYDWLLESGMKREDVGYFKDYVNHVWDKDRSNPDAYKEYVVNRQPTSSRNMRKREVRTLMDGLELGLVPEFSKIGDLMADYSKTNILAWANRKMLSDLSFIDVTERNEKGEETGHYNLLSSKKPTMFENDKYTYFDIPGVGGTWIYKPAAKDFALVFESYDAGKPMRVYDTVASLAKKIELSWSGFHAGALSEVYAVQNGIEFGPVKTAKYFYKYLINDCLKTGESPAYANPDLFQHAAKHLVKLGATDDYSAEAVQNVSQQLRDMLLTAQKELWKKGALGKSAAAVVAPLEVISEALKFINEGSDKLLWTWLHDGLKLATFKMREERTVDRLNKKYGDAVGSKEYEEELDKELDRDGQYVNDMFGGQHWEVINISPKTLRNMRRFLLSPDWLISTQRHFLGVFGYGDIYSHSRLKDFRRFYSMVLNGDGDPNSLSGLYAGIVGRGLKAIGINNKGADMPINAARLQRARSSLLCYILGVGLGYQFVNNALNAIMRKMDEEAELEKERTIDGHTSFYKKAYPEGMKWFDRNNMYNPMKMFGLFGDYGLEGNALGKKTHVFSGHYDNGAEIYLRTGKQFKEFPDFWENEKGELEFPKPLIKRLMGKSNPNIRFLYDILNYYNRWDKSKDDEDLEARFKKFSENKTFLGVGVGLYKAAQNFIPFWVPTQEGKEWVWTDTFFPSSKGFTPYKARTYFGEFIKAGDREGIKQTYMACAQNGMTDAQIDDAFTAALKAIESDERNSRMEQPKLLQTAIDAYDNAQTYDERRMAKKDIDKIMNGELHPEVTGEDILERFDEYEGKDTDKKVKAAKSEAYLNLCTSADVVEDARFRSAWKQLKEYHDELKEMEDEGAFKQDIDAYKKLYHNELKAYDEVNKRKNMIQNGERFDGIVFSKGKKQLGEGMSAEDISKSNETIMGNIRKWRKEALEIAGAVKPGKKTSNN